MERERERERERENMYYQYGFMRMMMILSRKFSVWVIVLGDGNSSFYKFWKNNSEKENILLFTKIFLYLLNDSWGELKRK